MNDKKDIPGTPHSIVPWWLEYLQESMDIYIGVKLKYPSPNTAFRAKKNTIFNSLKSNNFKFNQNLYKIYNIK